jgi:hypothetical protein
MVKIPSWVWIALPAIALLAVGVRGATQASYFRGIADDAEERLELQELVLDSVSAHADSLAAALARADSAVIAQRLQAEREVARLTRNREAARERSEVLSASLRASLDSAQVVELDAVVASYEVQISVLEEVIVVERGLTAAERLRAGQANELALGLRAVIVEREASATIMASQIAALRSSMQPSLALRIKADGWMALIGFGIGVLVTK